MRLIKKEYVVTIVRAIIQVSKLKLYPILCGSSLGQHLVFNISQAILGTLNALAIVFDRHYHINLTSFIFLQNLQKDWQCKLNQLTVNTSVM